MVYTDIKGEFMRKATVLTVMALLFLHGAGVLCALGERTLSLGAESSWSAVDRRTGVIELGAIRPTMTLTLSSARPLDDPSLDMALSFD